MNIPKYQQAQVQGQQPNLQAQQILLQQLQQGQSQQQQPSIGGSGSAGQFTQQDMYNDNIAQQGLYQNNYQRPVQAQQPPQLQNIHQQQQFFPQQFLLQQQNQPQTLLLQQYQQQQQQQPQIHLPQQYQQSQGQQVPHQPPHIQQQQFFNQQAAALQQQQQQQQLQQQQQPAQKLNSINIENPNSIYWQHQQQLCQLSRNANIPHYYARQYAANSRKNKNPYSDVKTVSLIDATRSMVSVLNEQENSKSNPGSATNSALLHNKKLAQDLDDDHLQEEQRMRQKTQGRQLWCQLVLGGQGLVNLSPKLFQYDFLESLYLNNNKLTSVPPVVNKLRSLRTLDLSHNRINEVPSELGMCFNLRYLYLFDNNIKTLPNEFGNLIELLFLGIEGNPIDLKIANLIAEKGTKELIAYLRDLKPSFGKPPPRQWLLLEDDGEIIDPITNPDAYTNDNNNSDTNDTFTMMSYNTLCQHYATTKMYKYTPSWALEWGFRRSALQEEILHFKSDLVCMQEVETRTFHEFWVPVMQGFGYKGVFFNKTRSKTMSESDSKKVDGCATFYKTDKFELIHKQNFEYNSVCMGSDKYKKTKDLFNRFMNKDNIALITYFNHIQTGEKILVVNTHLHWDPAFNDVKTLQVGILLEELRTIMKKYHHTNSIDEIKNASMVICGDFNSTKENAVYQLFSTGAVSNHEDLEGRDYGKFTDEGFRHLFKLKSAYDHVGELPFTTISPAFTDAIDYIWYSTPTLQVKGLLGKIDEEYSSHCIGFPNAHFPSDHIPLVTKFQIKKSGGNKKPDFKPDFKSGSSRKT